MMRDPELRTLVHQRLLGRHHANPKTLVVDELGINHGRSRIDIAVLNGSVSAIEIKTESDDLNRLERQISFYDQVAKKSILVVSDRHLDKATGMLPNWWGIVSLSVGPRGGAEFTRQRPAQINPTVDNVAVARLLWRDEAQQLLEKFGADKGEQRRPRAEMYQWLAESLSTETLTKSVLGKLKSRANWRGQKPLLPNDG